MDFFNIKNEDGIKTSGFKEAITIPKTLVSKTLITSCDLRFPYREHAGQNSLDSFGYVDSD